MAVPKKRTGHSAQGHRRSNWKATKTELTTCKNCGQPALTHTVCAACGYYKGKPASIKSPDYVEATVETKKVTKGKTSKSKAEVKEETTVIETEQTLEVEKEAKPKTKKPAAKKTTKKTTED